MPGECSKDATTAADRPPLHKGGWQSVHIEKIWGISGSNTCEALDLNQHDLHGRRSVSELKQQTAPFTCWGFGATQEVGLLARRWCSCLLVRCFCRQEAPLEQ